MVTLPPGTLLQLMYLRERIAGLPGGRFIEVGPGAGDITRLFLDAGWTGRVHDLSQQTADRLARRFSSEIEAGSLTVDCSDFLDGMPQADADVVVSCMVMEHLDEANEAAFMNQAAAALRPGGRMIGLVPASPAHWNIEDRIAGHYRRYTRESLAELAARSGWKITHMAGLTYPLSNLLLPLSNMLVWRTEKMKLGLSMQERTKQSGRRNVPMKTSFPPIFRFILNERVLTPFHRLQKFFSGHDDALVLFFEAAPGSGQPLPHAVHGEDCLTEERK